MYTYDFCTCILHVDSIFTIFVFNCSWRLVIHGGIDGYSRLLVFLGLSDNNRASTVLNLFIDAVITYGVPSRVRCDHGGENNDVCFLIDALRGPDHHAALRGKSTHNQRIERSWVDLWNGVTNVYHSLFNYLESVGQLDIANENHLWALHYVFVPRIQRDLKMYVGCAQGSKYYIGSCIILRHNLDKSIPYCTAKLV